MLINEDYLLECKGSGQPKMNFDHFPLPFWRQLHLKPFAFNNSADSLPNIWGFCSDILNHTILSSSSQLISFSIDKDGQALFFAAVYGCTSYILRRRLWSELALLQQNYHGHCCFVCDFNAIIGAHEKKRGNLPSSLSCEELQNLDRHMHLDSSANSRGIFYLV